MVFAVVFFLNSAANFVFGVVLGAWLGPAEFGRYATVALAATTLGGALFAWLKLSSLRFSGDADGRREIAASLDLGFIVMMAGLYLGVAAAALLGWSFGLAPLSLALMPLLAVALTRVDYSGAQFRAREQGGAFTALYGVRQLLAFTIVLAVVRFTRDSTMTLAALAATSFIPAVAVGRAMRTEGARLAHARASDLKQFLVYAKPIVASLVIYQVIALINRQAALNHLGADATGELSLATDVGMRLFLAFNSLPEMLLFQYALKREREEGLAAAEKQIGLNIVLVLALLAPLTAGYMAMLPTFQTLMVPAAYRGDFARLSLELAPGFFAFCFISSALGSVFQLDKRTWPLTIASVAALGCDFVALGLGGADSIDALARAYTISMGVGLAISAVLAFRKPGVRPRARDVMAIAAATLAMALAIRPLNGLGSPTLAALSALVVGGGLFGGAMLLFDVAGARAFFAEQWRLRMQRLSPLARS
jgi:O-antigen/teichoic acid export membrane protein